MKDCGVSAPDFLDLRPNSTISSGRTACTTSERPNPQLARSYDVLSMAFTQITLSEENDRRRACVSIEDRINDCLNSDRRNYRKTESGAEWVLVSRRLDRSSNRAYETWMDMRTGLMRGDRLEGRYTHLHAVSMAVNRETNEETVRAESVCGSERMDRAGCQDTDSIRP